MKRFLLIITSSILLFLSFLKINSFSFGFLAYISFIPIFILIDENKNTFITGYLFGLFFYLLLLYWVPFSNVESESKPWIVLGFFLLISYLSIYFGLSFYLSKKKNLFFLFPVIFSGFEFFRSLSSSFGFTWGSIAQTQSYYRYIIQIADIGGIPLLTFFILMVNYLLYKFIKDKKIKYFLIALSLFAFVFVYSFIDIKTLRNLENKLSFEIIQLNISPDEKRYNDYESRKETIKEMIKEGSDLYILPESSAPCNVVNYENCSEIFKKISDSLNAAIIVGTIEFERGDRFRYYNSAALFNDGLFRGVHRKKYLVPFVERLPYNDIFPFLNKIDFGQGSFSPGKSYKIFEVKGFKFCTVICFEQIFPRLIRRYVREGADFIVNITEDAWFGKTLGPYQHFENSIMRAVEYKKPVLRCANSGISAYIDPTGKIIEKTNLFERRIIKNDLYLYKRKTIYTIIGDFFGWAFILTNVFIILFTSRRKYFKHRTAVIEKYAKVGEGTKIWHFSHIMGIVGKNCNIGQNVFIGKDAKVGNNVKIQNGVNIYTMVEIGDNCFIGPEVTFTHNKYPRAPFPRYGKWLKTIVEEGVTIGANSTILCDLRIGKWAMIGAGSVVTKDVPQFGLVYGNPARLKGFICICGNKLYFKNNRAICSCGRKYKKRGNKVDLEI